MKNFNPLENWKDFLKLIGIVILAFAAFVFYGRLSLETKCENLVNYVPAKGGTAAGVWSHPSEDAYFTFGAEKFESRESAVLGCVRKKGQLLPW